MRGGMVALVNTDVTSPQSMLDSTGPTSMGERRSRTLRRVPSTQATSPSPRVSNRCKSSARCTAACSVRVLRLARSGSGSDPPPSRNERCAPPRRRASVTRRLMSAPRLSSSASSRSSTGGRASSCSTRVPTRSPSSEPSWSPTDAKESSRSASRCSTRERAEVTSERKRPGVTSTPRLDVMTSSSSCASSKITTSCSGSTTPPLARCAPYRWVLTTTTSATDARSRAASAKQRPPDGQL